MRLLNDYSFTRANPCDQTTWSVINTPISSKLTDFTHFWEKFQIFWAVLITAWRLKIFSALLKILSAGRYECPRTGNVIYIFLIVLEQIYVSTTVACGWSIFIYFIPAFISRVKSEEYQYSVFFKKSSSAEGISVVPCFWTKYTWSTDYKD